MLWKPLPFPVSLLEPNSVLSDAPLCFPCSPPPSRGIGSAVCTVRPDTDALRDSLGAPALGGS